MIVVPKWEELAYMRDRLRIDYLAAFDTGNASIRWPQKDAAAANRDQHSFDAEIKRALKLNLLLKPFISIRHFELFDNLALAKFASANRFAFQRLCDADLVRVCSKLARRWEEICMDWAVQGSGDRMHWHHLTPDRQKSYDLASRKGEITDLESMDAYLRLLEHEDVDGCPLNLRKMAALYDKLFPPHKIIATSSSESMEWPYAKMVEKELATYLERRKQRRGSLPAIVSTLEKTVMKCCERGVRRREFYTELERVAHESRSTSGQVPQQLAEEVAALKAFVINEAFYKEFQQFDRYVCGADSGDVHIVANRDITKPWVRYEDVLPKSPIKNIEEYLEKETFPVLDAISLEDILEWHTASNDEATSFRASMRTLQELCAMPNIVRDRSKVSQVIKEHLKSVDNCVKRSFSASDKTSLREAPGAEVYFGSDLDLEVGVAVFGLLELATYMGIHTELLAVVSVAAVTFLLKRPTKSDPMHHFETTLESQARSTRLRWKCRRADEIFQTFVKHVGIRFEVEE